jgi:hypothetical protein
LVKRRKGKGGKRREETGEGRKEKGFQILRFNY